MSLLMRFVRLRPARKGTTLLTEQEVSRSFQSLFSNKVAGPDVFAKAEALLDELRGESPLRHRLSTELAELRRIHGVEQAV